MSETRFSTVVFDLDGTLIDSDDALAAAFHALGVDRADITYGHVLADECERLGISLDDYLAAYDSAAVRAYPGVEELLSRLPRWGVCSNKHGPAGRAELALLGWTPAVALFADHFDGPKELRPVLAALDVAAAETLFVGDTDHDRACAVASGCGFAMAAWNPRARAAPGDIVLTRPAEVLRYLTR